jgi:hypothetical protein
VLSFRGKIYYIYCILVKYIQYSHNFTIRFTIKLCMKYIYYILAYIQHNVDISLEKKPIFYSFASISCGNFRSDKGRKGTHTTWIPHLCFNKNGTNISLGATESVQKTSEQIRLNSAKDVPVTSDHQIATEQISS